LSDQPFDDGPSQSQRAVIAQQAQKLLEAAVENMCRELGLSRTPEELVSDIKATLYTLLPPYSFNILETLCERYRADAFNDNAAETFPVERNILDKAIGDLATAQGVPIRKARRLSDNAWKWDLAADRRARGGSAQPCKGRPEVYDRDVVWSFHDAIARAIGQPQITWTRRIDDNKSIGATLDVLVAAVRWAMCVAWQCSAKPGTKFPEVRAEGLIGIIKHHRRTD
jgi:hypothetical protein